MVQSLKERAHHIRTATRSVYDPTQQWRREQDMRREQNIM